MDAQTAEERYAIEPMDRLSPEQIYERRWPQTLLTGTLQRLRDEFSTSGRVALFVVLEPHFWGEMAKSSEQVERHAQFRREPDVCHKRFTTDLDQQLMLGSTGDLPVQVGDSPTGMAGVFI